jgi:dipeptidyl aminopeptidase/acylaminoacyl peptidase
MNIVDSQHGEGQAQRDDGAPWKERFRAPAVLWSAIAHNAPGRGVVATNCTGTYQLYAWDVASGALRQITDRPEGQILGSISPDGQFVYYVDDRQGNELGHLGRVPSTGGVLEDLTPNLPTYGVSGVALAPAGGRLALIAATADGYHLYCLEADDQGHFGAPRRLFHETHGTFGVSLSHAGEVAVVSTTTRSGTTQFNLVAIDVASSEVIGDLWDGQGTSIGLGPFAPLSGDLRLLATTNRSGVTRPLLWNPSSGERTDLALSGIAGSVDAWDWSWDGHLLLLCQTYRAVQQLFTYDLRTGTLTRLEHPSGSFRGAYFTPSGEIFAAWQDADQPPCVLALDGATGQPARLALSSGAVAAGHPWRSVSFASSDGQEIQAWLAVPEGTGPFPTILEMHGGPAAVATADFDPSAQMWVDHGFAFLTVNFRGSTTFGQAFQDKIIGDPGHWEVEDMVAARDWLVREGIARPEAILLTGWSYGGYLTLLALGKRPELWAGGMAGIAIADWTVQWEDTSPVLRGYQEALLGGTPPQRPEHYARSSPITYAEEVRAPILIIQGRNDTRTPARPVEMYAAKLRALGKRVELEWFDAGHLGAFASVELAIAHNEMMLRFATEVVGHRLPSR